MRFDKKALFVGLISLGVAFGDQDGSLRGTRHRELKWLPVDKTKLGNEPPLTRNIAPGESVRWVCSTYLINHSTCCVDQPTQDQFQRAVVTPKGAHGGCDITSAAGSLDNCLQQGGCRLTCDTACAVFKTAGTPSKEGRQGEPRPQVGGTPSVTVNIIRAGEQPPPKTGRAGPGTGRPPNAPPLPNVGAGGGKSGSGKSKKGGN